MKRRKRDNSLCEPASRALCQSRRKRSATKEAKSGIGPCAERAAFVRRRVPGDVRGASRLAARRPPFPHRRGAGRGDAGGAVRPRRARAVGRKLPADAVRARRRQGAARRDPGQFRGRQPRGARPPTPANRRASTPGSSSPACSDAPIHLAVFCDEATGQGHGLGARTMPEARRYSTICALHTFWLAARAHGLGVGWVSILDPATIAERSTCRARWTFIAYLCVGFPREEHLIPELERVGWQAQRGASRSAPVGGGLRPDVSFAAADEGRRPTRPSPDFARHSAGRD